tara:strand:+ start:292 stop:795 length:504 start_codon:yes stop_codon:yes gene_type:complete
LNIPTSEEEAWGRLEQLLSFVKQAREHGRFQMDRWFLHPDPVIVEDGWCGTSACLAGHAVSRWENWLWDERGDRIHITADTNEVPQVAAKLLGLTPRQSDWLFCAIPDGCYVDTDETSYCIDVRGYSSHEAAAIAYLEKCIALKEIIPPGKLFPVVPVHVEDQVDGE